MPNNILDKIKALIKKEEEVVLKALDEEQRLFLGVVLEPESYDLHKDIYSADAIKKACAQEQQYLQSNVQHSVQVDDSVMTVTKSFIQEVDAKIGEEVIKAGTWLREAKIKSDPLWEAVKKGEFTGWSIGCSAQCDDVPVNCIKSEEDIEKAKWDHQKFQRLDNFDFSANGAHIALVDRAANGFKALVIKSVEAQEEPKPIVKEVEPQKPVVDPIVAKSNNGDNSPMSDNVEVIKAEDVEAMIKKAVEASEASFKVELEKSEAKISKFEEAEEVRKQAKFDALATKYAVLGDVEGIADVLKGMEGAEGSEKVLALLDSALETLDKADLLKEEGVDGEGEALTSAEELKKLADALAVEKSITIQKAMVEIAQARPDLVK